MEKRISLRLSSAAPVTFSGLSPPRLTQSLMISSAWMGCSSSYFACSSSHQRPRGPIFSFLARPRSAFSERSEEHTSELQSRLHLVCRLLLEKKRHYHFTFSLHHSTSSHFRCWSGAPHNE